MAEAPRPAYTRGESVYDISRVIEIPDLTPDWAWQDATGEGVRVAVVDSGVEAEHPALEGCVDVDAGVALSLADDGSVREKTGPHDDAFGHGTACAGIIHAIAPEARIASVRVLDARLTGRAAVFLRGLAWAVEREFDVINLSLGTGRRDWALPFYEICDQAYFRGCFVVTAANNIARPSFPSLYGAVASVACNLSTDPMEFHFNPDPPTEFLARGIDVEVAWRDGGTQRVTGNSFAAPHISGIAALIRSKHPGLRPFQVKTALTAVASNMRTPERALAGRHSGVMQRTLSTVRAQSALHSVIGREPPPR
jgi:subtilisin